VLDLSFRYVYFYTPCPLSLDPKSRRRKLTDTTRETLQVDKTVPYTQSRVDFNMPCFASKQANCGTFLFFLGKICRLADSPEFSQFKEVNRIILK
jgi:hypothetical protein